MLIFFVRVGIGESAIVSSPVTPLSLKGARPAFRLVERRLRMRDIRNNRQRKAKFVAGIIFICSAWRFVLVAIRYGYRLGWIIDLDCRVAAMGTDSLGVLCEV